MKKAKKWPSILLAAFTVFSFGACEEWGKADPPAGNDTYPKLEQVVNITFEDDAFDPTSMDYYAYPNGEVAEVVKDDEARGKVLHLPGGYARIFNPMASYKAQNGVSLTFWVKQPLIVDEETGETKENDLTSALFSFQNENATQKLFFTANGWLSYDGVDGEYEALNPENVETGMLDGAGEWHYVALTVRNDGYNVFVDGKQRVNETVTNFDFSKIVQFMASCAYMYIGEGAGTEDEALPEFWIDDIKIYRNQIGSSEQAVPSGGGEADYHNWVISGSEDFTDGFFAVQTKLVKFKTSAHFGFYNYTDMAANWNNWVIVLTNGKAFGESGYAEHFVLRGDAYGWGDAHYDGTQINHTFNFDNFTSEMNGAYVDITLTRNENTVNMAAVVTGSSGQTYTYNFSYTGELEETIGAFITGEKNYIKLDAEQVYADGESFTPGSYLVGPEDCSAGWWSVFSDNYVIKGNNEYPFGIIFTNNTNGQNNWNNWILVATNGVPLNGAGYAEYFVLRADAYGWGDANYSGDNISHGFNWDTFKDDMQGAYVRLFVNRNNTNLSMNTIIRTASGSVLTPYTYSHTGISTDEVGVFLTAEGASLDICTVGYFPYASDVVQ